MLNWYEYTQKHITFYFYFFEFYFISIQQVITYLFYTY